MGWCCQNLRTQYGRPMGSRTRFFILLIMFACLFDTAARSQQTSQGSLATYGEVERCSISLLSRYDPGNPDQIVSGTVDQPRSSGWVVIPGDEQTDTNGGGVGSEVKGGALDKSKKQTNGGVTTDGDFGESEQPAAIVGGTATAYGQFDETVMLTARDPDTSKPATCSGVIVAPNTVLTAAHCVCDLKLNHKSRSQNKARVSFGIFENPKIIFEKEEQIFNRLTENRTDNRPVIAPFGYVIPETVKLYDQNFCEGFKRFRSAYIQGNDLALLKFEEVYKTEFKSNRRFVYKKPVLDNSSSSGVSALKETSQMSVTPEATRKGSTQKNHKTREIRVAMIAARGLTFSPGLSQLLAVGYGANDDPKSPIELGVKYQGCLPIESRICGYAEDRIRFRCTAGLEMVLMDRTGKKDTCGGDSGGPVFAVVHNVDGNLNYYLVGITSRGLSGRACGPGGVYTLVSPRVVDWMRSEGVFISAYQFPEQ